ncbi:MAG TPA: ABC transporter, partial [Selenomonas sp.]|nr:ABC transporter [Selenomonas sp.]
LADKVFAYEPDGSLKLYTGGYTYYQQRREAEKAARVPRQESAPAAPKSVQEKPRSQDKPRRFTFSEQKEYAEIEGVIASTEGELKVVHKLMEQSAADYGKLNELSQQETALSAKLDQLMERWTYLEEIAEAQQDS